MESSICAQRKRKRPFASEIQSCFRREGVNPSIFAIPEVSRPKILLLVLLTKVKPIMADHERGAIRDQEASLEMTLDTRDIKLQRSNSCPTRRSRRIAALNHRTVTDPTKCVHQLGCDCKTGDEVLAENDQNQQNMQERQNTDTGQVDEGDNLTEDIEITWATRSEENMKSSSSEDSFVKKCGKKMRLQDPHEEA